MDKSNGSADVVRFGAFEVDPRSGELRKGGVKIRLQDQPFQLLVTLLAQPGEVVTSEELQKQLWPSDTFVDFDQGLRTAIRKLREALGDSADNPRFVETLPRRGYRFIAPVSRIGRAGGAQPEVLPKQSEAPQPAQRRQPRLAVLVTAALLVLVALAYWLRPSLPAPRVSAYRKLTSDGRPKGDVLQTDGKRIYFSETTSKERSNRVLAAVSTEGGEPVTIPTPLREPTLEGISPDGTELLLIERATEPPSVYVVSTLDGTTRRLGNILGWCGTWLPDGRIMYLGGTNDLYVVDRDGRGARKLVTKGGAWPRSSPDGRLVRFSADGIWEVGSDGRGLRPLFPGSSAECCGDWTADQKYFIFQSTKREGGIWAMREKGDFTHAVRRDAVQVAAGVIDLSGPISSQDGKKLFALGTLARPEMLRYDSKLREFVPYLSGISGEWMEFSRDGQWLTYTDWDGTLWQSKADGSGRLQLTFPPMRVEAPRWSPDGKRITFCTTAPGNVRQIYIVAAGGGIPEQVAPEEHTQADPTWSPDGTSIVFSYNSLDGYDPNTPGIYILDLKTRQVSKIPGSEKLGSPRWSPDGRYICALALDSPKIVLFDFNTKKWGELAEGNVTLQNWSRDSQYVYYQRWGDPLILRVRVRDRKIEQVAKLAEAKPYSGLGPDNSPLVRGAPLIQEIYALDWEAP